MLRPKTFAGEVEKELTHKHCVNHNTVGYCGFLPGVGAVFGEGFPKLNKMSEHARQLSPLANEARRPAPKKNEANDTRSYVANLYLTAVHPSQILDMHEGVGKSSGFTPPTAATTPTYKTVVMKGRQPSAPMPKHVQGYSGYRQHIGDAIGEPFNRLEARCSLRIQCSVTPVAGEYELHNQKKQVVS